MENYIQHYSLLKSIPLFSCLNQQQMSELSSIISFEHYSKHHYIYRQKDVSDSFCFLLSGTLKIGYFQENYDEIITNIQTSVGIFGEKSLTGEKLRHEFAEVINDEVKILKVKSNDFLQMFIRDIPTQMNLLSTLSNKIRETEERIEYLIGKDARTRIILFLKQNIKSSGTKVGYEILLQNNFTQMDIAKYTGTSRQTVTQVFNQLKKLNIIRFNKRNMLVSDVARLV